MRQRNLGRIAIVSAVFGGALLARGGVNLTISATSPEAAPQTTSWPSSPDGTIPHFPETTTGNPAAGAVTNQTFDGGVIAETFKTTNAFTVGSIAFVGNGGSVQIGIHIFPFNNTFTNTSSGGYVPATSFAGADLLGGGSGLSVTFGGAPSSRIITFDLTDTDEVTLAANTAYTFEMWVVDPTHGTNALNTRRGGNFTTNGSLYQATAAGAQSATSTVSRNGIVGGPPNNGRTMVFAVYPAATTGPSPKSITWSAAVNTTWDHATNNWINNADNVTAVSFNDGDSVAFGNAGVGPVNLSGSDKPASISIGNSSGTYVFGGSGSIDGATGVSISGGGSSTFNSPNGFTGGTTITAGTVTLNSTAALGTGFINVANFANLVANADGTYTTLGLGAGGGGIINIAAGHTLSFSGPASGGGLTTTGPGTLSSTGTLLTNLDINNNNGLLLVNGAIASSVTPLISVLNAGGSTRINPVASTTASPVAANVFQIAVDGSHDFTIGVTNRPTNKQAVVIADDLAIDGGGHVDLGNNDLIIHGQGVDTLINYFKDGSLKASSTGGAGANAYTTLAIVAANTPDGMGGTLFGATFDGQAIVASDILVKYTYAGDANLDGIVDGNDLAIAMAGLHGGLAGWTNGDFNYDGSITSADITLLLSSLRHQTQSFSDGGSGGGSIPEPTTFALATPALALLTRRRR